MKVIQPLIQTGTVTRGISESISTTSIDEIKRNLNHNQGTKSTEKKKRTSKSPKFIDIIVVIEALSFLNDRKYGIDADELFKSSLPVYFQCFPNCKGANNNWLQYAKDKNLVKHLEETRAYCRDLVRALVANADIDSKWATKAMEPFQTVIIGSNPPRKTLKMKGFADSGTVGAIRAYLVNAIVDAFIHGGKAYIGACPRCKKIFEKRRKDQLSCSRTCRTSAGVEKIRKSS